MPNLARSIDMRPEFSANDFAEVSLGNAELACQVLLVDVAEGISSPDFAHLLWRQLGEGIPLSTRSAASLATLPKHVTRVVGRSAHEEVVDIDTEGMVAGVADIQPCRDIAAVDLPGDAVRAIHPAGTGGPRQRTVLNVIRGAVRCATDPPPAFVGLSASNIQPETLNAGSMSQTLGPHGPSTLKGCGRMGMHCDLLRRGATRRTVRSSRGAFFMPLSCLNFIISGPAQRRRRH
jgi:hypothetical protein